MTWNLEHPRLVLADNILSKINLIPTKAVSLLASNRLFLWIFCFKGYLDHSGVYSQPKWVEAIKFIIDC